MNKKKKKSNTLHKLQLQTHQRCCRKPCMLSLDCVVKVITKLIKSSEKKDACYLTQRIKAVSLSLLILLRTSFSPIPRQSLKPKDLCAYKGCKEFTFSDTFDQGSYSG